MDFIFVGANITNKYWIGYLFSVERHCRFWDEVNGIGAVDSVPNALGQPCKFISQRLVPGCFIEARNEMATLLKSTSGGVNDGLGLETVVESGQIGISGADECWLLMAVVTERVPGPVVRDDMWRPGQVSIIRLREGGPGTASQGGSG